MELGQYFKSIQYYGALVLNVPVLKREIFSV